MTEYDSSWWSENGFAPEYLTGADIFYLDRARFLNILKFFYRYFFKGRDDVRILDLGCGDGILTHELLKLDASVKATLIDGSEDMIAKAAERLSEYKNVSLVTSSFQEVLNGKTRLKEYDLVVSSQAIHHLKTDEKTALFRLIYSRLIKGGRFVNIDVVRSPLKDLEGWYLFLWKEWILKRQAESEPEKDYTHVIDKYKRSGHYETVDTLDAQLDALKDAGFKDIDCYYKHGIFVMYGCEK